MRNSRDEINPDSVSCEQNENEPAPSRPVLTRVCFPAQPYPSHGDLQGGYAREPARPTPINGILAVLWLFWYVRTQTVGIFGL